MSGTDAQVVCQQCNENFARKDVKEIYDEQVEICGFVCNACCIKSAESARRCQVSVCKTKPDSGPTGFRTLPSKFYDLPEGEVKKRIIKQFGIFRNVRACCNMCYVRISKSVVQMKIVYGDGLPSPGKFSPSKASKHMTQNTVGEKANRDDRLAVYTGPKFTRRSGSAPSWNKTKLQADDNIVPSNVSELLDNNNFGNSDEQNESLKDSKEGEDTETSNSDLKRQSCMAETDITRADSFEVDKSVDKGNDNKIAAFSYSSIPISPTSMRFRRIQLKVSRFDEFDLSDDLLDSPENEMTLRGRKRSKDNDDETWSPVKPKKERVEGRGINVKKTTPVYSNVMSDFVSCTGCRKICSSKETIPVFDEKKQINVRLCNECSSVPTEGRHGCPIKGCTTPKNGMNHVQINFEFENLDEAKKKQISELGVDSETKTCCSNCLNNINAIVKKDSKSKEVNNTEEEVFTMCRNCCKIVPMRNTCPNIEENGRKCGVLCQMCSGAKDHVKDADSRKEQKVAKKMKGTEQNVKTSGFCTAKGCVHAGEKEPVQLVSGKKILRNYLDEKMLRAEFDLADDVDYCCRSCHARIKWFVADVKKRELGVSPDSKNSLKHLTPKIKSEVGKSKPEKSTMPIDENQEESNQGEKDNKTKITKFEKKQDEKSVGQISSISTANASSVTPKTCQNIKKEANTRRSHNGGENANSCATKDAVKPEAFPVKNIAGFQNPTISNFSSKTAIIIPPVNTTTVAGHPSVLQVGGQQFVLNVISRCEKESQTEQKDADYTKKEHFKYSDKGVQANIPLMPKFEGTVPANLPNGKKVKYVDAKEKTKYAVKRAGKELLDQFLQQLDDISGGCSQQLLSDIYRSKEVVMATNYKKILSSIGMLYRNTDKSNRQERLRLLSTVALHAPNETLKRFFQRNSKRGDLISVNEAEIVQAREYAKQFGPGIHVMPIGQVSWKNFASVGITESADDDEQNENEMERGTTKQKTEKLEDEGDNAEEKVKKSTDKESMDNKDGRLSPDIPVKNKEGEKKLITFEKMKKAEQGAGENGTEQLVTFKVTVRQAKEKANKDENETMKATEEPNRGSETKSVGKERVKNEKEAVKAENEAQEKAGKSSKKKKRMSTGSLENGEEIYGNASKKIKRKSLDSQPKERGKNKSDGNKGDPAGDPREKRKRTAFNNEKKNVLEQYFEKNIYASKSVVEEISRELGIDKKKIDNWFRNRRSKLKKDEEEMSKRNVELKKRKGGKSDTKNEKGNEKKQCNQMSNEVKLENGIAEEGLRRSDSQVLESESVSSEESNENTNEYNKEIDNENDTKGTKDVENNAQIIKEKQNTFVEKAKETINDEKTKILSVEGECDKPGKHGTNDDDKNDSRKFNDKRDNDDTRVNQGIDEIKEEQEMQDIKNPFMNTDKDVNNEHINQGTAMPESKQRDVHKSENDKLKIETLVEKTISESLPASEKFPHDNDFKEENYFPAKESKIKRNEGNTKDENETEENCFIEVKNNMKNEKPEVELISKKENNDDDEVNKRPNIAIESKSEMQKENFEIDYAECVTEVPIQLPEMPCETIIQKKSENKVEMQHATGEQMQFREVTSLEVNGKNDDENCGMQFSKTTTLIEHEMPVKILDAGLGISDKEQVEQTKNIVENTSSSLADGTSFAFGVIEEYENENEGSQGEELALALNNDPEFMKDLNELMDIAKT